MKNIILMGPPGSGKDTQIDQLKECFNAEIIGGGDIARRLSETNPEYARIVRSGGLLDDNLVLDEVSKVLDGVDGTRGVIFDGFPRTIQQAEKLNQVLAHHGRTLDNVVYIALDEEEVVNRLSKRKVCAICGKDIPPSQEKCLADGGRAVRRPDDEPATIINRMQTYLDRTVPLIDYYKMKGILAEVNGDQTIENVTKDIKEKLDLCKLTN
jgi:adenylate kinase